MLVVSLTDFGWSGPWEERPATEFTLQALCGATGFRGFPEGPPVSVGGRIGEYVGGMYAALAVLAAARVHTGCARSQVRTHVASGLPCRRFPARMHDPNDAGSRVAPCVADGSAPILPSVEIPSIEPAKDGWVGMSMVTGQQWRDFATMVEQPLLVDDPELSLQLGRWPRRAEVFALIHPWLATRTVAEVVELASLYRVPMAAVGNGATIPEMDHFEERRVFVEHPAGFRQPRPPWQMSVCAPALPCRSGPRRKPCPARPLAPPPARPGLRSLRRCPFCFGPSLPLSGVRFVDFTAFWAGPSATFILGALGADVVKIESVQRPDGIRFAGGPAIDHEKWWEHSWIFHGVNAGKRSVTLDLGDPEGLGLVRRLIGADAVVENFSPRVIDQFGLGWEELHAVNPESIMVRMPAFGLDGPWRDRSGSRRPWSSCRVWRGEPASRWPAHGAQRGVRPYRRRARRRRLLAALSHRDRTGEGQLVEVPMVEVALNLTAEQVIEHQVDDVLLQRDGNRGVGAPQNVYRCAGDDSWIALAVETDAQWRGWRAPSARRHGPTIPPWPQRPAGAGARCARCPLSAWCAPGTLSPRSRPSWRRESRRRKSARRPRSSRTSNWSTGVSSSGSSIPTPDGSTMPGCPSGPLRPVPGGATARPRPWVSTMTRSSEASSAWRRPRAGRALRRRHVIGDRPQGL